MLMRLYLSTCSVLVLLLPAHLVLAYENMDYHPFETRDQNLFNLIHGQALPGDARLNKKSQGLWSGSLIITNALNIESNNNEDIYLDYEAYRFNLSYQYGLTENWNLKLDVPLMHLSGGSFDSAIENWHEFFGLPRGMRPYVEHNQESIQYTFQGQARLDINEENTSLGDIQIAVAHLLVENYSTTMSLWASLKLPTGDENKLSGNGATDYSAWIALNQKLTDNWLINLNTGAVILGGDNYKSIPLSDYALYGHVMLGWLATENLTLKLQLQGHTRYYDQSELKVLGNTYFLTFGGTIAINQCNQLDIALSEDIKVSASPDASLLINWRHASHCE